MCGVKEVCKWVTVCESNIGTEPITLITMLTIVIITKKTTKLEKLYD